MIDIASHTSQHDAFVLDEWAYRPISQNRAQQTVARSNDKCRNSILATIRPLHNRQKLLSSWSSVMSIATGRNTWDLCL